MLFISNIVVKMLSWDWYMSYMLLMLHGVINCYGL